MKRKVVAVDFDDVVAAFYQAYMLWHNQKYGTTMTVADAYTFDMVELWGLPEETLVERLQDFSHNHHASIQMTKGVKVALERLKENFELHIVTSRCETLTDVTKSWLHSKGINHFEDMHFLNGFGSPLPPKGRKLDVLEHIGASVLIEDAPINARRVASAGIPVLMPQRRWNKGYKQEGVIPMHSWHKAVAWIENNL